MADIPALVPGARFTGSPHRLSRTDFVRYAGISGDLNPMHHDEVRAHAAGEPSVSAHGMFCAGLLATALTDLFGPTSLRRYRCRFTRQVRPEECMVGEFTVRATEAADGGLLAELDCVLRSQAGVAVTGRALVAVSR